MKKLYSLIFITPDGATKKQLNIPSPIFKLIVGLLIFLAAAFIFMGIFLGKVYSDAIQKKVFEERVRRMEVELKKVDKLKKDILFLYDRNEKIKQLLGIDIQNKIIRSHSDESKVLKIDSMMTLDSLKNAINSTPDIFPTDGIISRRFSQDHSGIDIATNSGSPVVSTIEGTVSDLGWDAVYGNYVKIKNASVTIFYGHMSKTFVQNHQTIRKGELVGLVGSTGRSTAPHLHYEIAIDSSFVDPEKFLPKKEN